MIDLVDVFYKKKIMVVAEGIETKEELHNLQSNTDVDYFQ